MAGPLALRLLTLSGTAAAGPPRLFRLHKRLTAIGRSPDNDIVLADAKVHASHAYVQLDGGDCVAVAVGDDIYVNGKRKSKCKLSLGDTLRLGGSELILSSEEAPAAISTEERDRAALSAYRKLHAFSEKLLNRYELDGLLSALIDAVIEITGADQGFLVLVDDKEPRVMVARTLHKETLADPADKLSDSIVKKVLRTAQPVILSDALGDAEFSTAESVMHLRLSSVMCVPLRERGNLLGALYVGSSQVKSLFQPSDLEVLTVLAAQAALILQNARLVSALRQDNQRLGAELQQMRFGSVLSIGAGAGASSAMQEVLRTVAKVAGTEVSVLITGETGTGKELIAQELHRRSPRKDGPLIAINCGAIPEQLLESELFGYVRGAFTGAERTKPGRFQAASGGTLFLDEIGEMPLGLQVKLLRVLQERAVTRVGDTRAEPVDVRVACATHRDLLAEIRAGRFREDLYYRLNVVQIHLPPLRERGEDVLILAKYFLHRFAGELDVPARTLSAMAELAIQKHPWPGNIRQLENHIKKALVLSERGVLEPEDLGLLPAGGAAALRTVPLAEAKERFARDYVREVLAKNGGNRTQTARDLDVDPRTIFRFLEKEGGEELEERSEDRA